MSTRATVHFHWQGEKNPTAIVYRHSDGYPDGLGKDLQEFFKAVKEQTRDTRFNDPSYLAAKFVVWQADRYAVKYDWDSAELKQSKANMLDFLSVGIVLDDPGDIEYRYKVMCGDPDENGFPTVIIQKVE